MQSISIGHLSSANSNQLKDTPAAVASNSACRMRQNRLRREVDAVESDEVEVDVDEGSCQSNKVQPQSNSTQAQSNQSQPESSQHNITHPAAPIPTAPYRTVPHRITYATGLETEWNRVNTGMYFFLVEPIQAAASDPANVRGAVPDEASNESRGVRYGHQDSGSDAVHGCERSTSDPTRQAAVVRGVGGVLLHDGTGA